MHYILGGTKVAKMAPAGTKAAAPKKVVHTRPTTGSTTVSAAAPKKFGTGIGGGGASAAENKKLNDKVLEL